MGGLLPEFARVRDEALGRESGVDLYGKTLRPLTRAEVSSLIQAHTPMPGSIPDTDPRRDIALRKLKLQRQRGFADLPVPALSLPPSYGPSTPLIPLLPSRPVQPPNPAVLDALHAIKSTPYAHSFAARLNGGVQEGQAISVDWEGPALAPWVALMEDVRAHYALAHPEREQVVETAAPISYVSLQARHLGQVHELLERAFWAGVDVSDSLQHAPKKSTILATYKRLVVGVANLSSPQEPYITYLAVRAGWDGAQIATSMLYHLIQLNPNRDITLHVSANNPAMLLYNRFGFKAEEFVAGFYEDYLDPQSRASKNAFRLRLRR
ncbi:hypothetical protein FIBSPDRAFT_137673 [Athelia psychrophila]|uniref:N-acetyltransferase domain-containing protein n=1 Tax=Athelia psychrophila TaxID=1759441 RepID=A0A166C1R0_9AGAM|nr:hypothetical protein FIBSPDRAFT_137673 [Fibularhizoctonia sp. CBS 109695]